MQRNRPAIDRLVIGPQSITEIGPVAALAQKANKLEALDRALRQTLISPLREQVRFANLRGDRLVFLASTPAWASRLRLQQTQILNAAHAIGVAANSMSVKVAPLPPPYLMPESTKSLSAAAAAHLKAAANTLSDPELRTLFLDLAAVAELPTSK